ncbi:MAG TPA: T9SS type A sorting domain-containing protein, partial [Membranihabitans sp.]|nr:T9SS type A sorting domain-containing protein [Membranihabitans sp.]
EETYAFYHFPNLYMVYPNPIQDFITIELDESANNKLTAIHNSAVTNEIHELKIYNQYNGLIRAVSLGSNFGSYRIEASKYKPGIYVIELRNPYFTKRYKVQKL